MSAPALLRCAAPPAEILLRDVRLFDPAAGVDARCDLLVRGGAIVELGAPGTLLPAMPPTGLASAEVGAESESLEVVDGGGRLYALPAFVDPHVHLRSPGQEHKEDIESGTRAAAAGGYGAVVAMPNTAPAIDSPELLRSVRATAAAQAHVPVGFLPALTRGLEGTQLTEMAQLREQGALGFTDDGNPVASAGILREALQRQRECGGMIALHEEDRSLSRGGAMHEGALSEALGIPGIPCASEASMVARDAVLAGCEGARVHFQHLSCSASVETVAAAKAAGVRVSAEATPHHLLLTEQAVRGVGGEAGGQETGGEIDRQEQGLDTRAKMNPPLATEADRTALVEGLRAGTIDCVATDHAPHAQAEKARPFTEAPMGTTGLETAFAALYTDLVLPGVLSLGVLVRRMTAAAALLELPVPTIAQGEQANIALVDLDAEWVAGEHGWQSRSANSCFAGRRLRGKVLLTVAAGAVAYRATSLSTAVAA
jgi:dihydroorotase